MDDIMHHSSPRTDHEPGLAMTSMIDVTFLLLIFFLFAFRFPTLEGKLGAYLPAAVESGGGPIERVEVLLEVIEEGRKMEPFEPGEPWSAQPGTRFVYDDSRVIEYSIGPRRTREMRVLRERLEMLFRAGHRRYMTIDARRGTTYDDVVGVIDAALSAGFTEVGFVGSYE